MASVLLFLAAAKVRIGFIRMGVLEASNLSRLVGFWGG